MNQMLQCIVGQRDFESACLNLDKLPTVPPYWRRMCGQNQAGPAPLGILTEPPAIRPDELARRINERAGVRLPFTGEFRRRTYPRFS
jgi:hydroxyacylglutathione hydrolase